MAVWCLYLTHLLSLISSAAALTLLSAVAADPELSTLTAVMAGMGTSPDKPDPRLEERFNSRLDGRNYTFFAPTNAVSPSFTSFVKHKGSLKIERISISWSTNVLGRRSQKSQHLNSKLLPYLPITSYYYLS